MSKPIVFEEDIEAAVVVAEKIFGPNGRMMYPHTKKIILDAKIGSDAHGTLWYGDFHEKEDAHKLQDLASALGVVVWVSK